MLIFILLTLLTQSYVQLSLSRSVIIKKVDFNVEQFNQHRTVKFYQQNSGVSKVIVRRAGHLKFSVELNKPFKGEKIQTILTFETRQDRMVINLPSANVAKKWSMSQYGVSRRIYVKIYIPAKAPVGVWKLRILLKNTKGQVIEKLDLSRKIVVLFNPWSKLDAAYFPVEKKLNEYLFNEIGYMYSFNYINWSSYPWIFGQFQRKVFDAILFVLDKAKLTAAERGDIVLVTRELTYLMNDDGIINRGVLQGRWREPYGPLDGRMSTKPWEWTGSPAIFEQYYESGGEPVGYGQCWVFAGILTTAYRALGIASRPVSNFLSAHSRNRDLTIDILLDENGDIRSQESVWNFHVWVQAWFSRSSDLGNNYSGWQELDSTPQEMSNGRFQVGPASNIAIRNSRLRTRFQSSFLYEEVNADEVVWSADGRIISVHTDKIGIALLTKKYGSSGPEDITNMYKPTENTVAERKSYRLAALSLGISPPSLHYTSLRSSQEQEQIIIDIETTKRIIIGSPVFCKVSIKNSMSSSKRLEVRIKAIAMYYNGEIVSILKVETQNIEVAALRKNTIEFEIKPEEYIGKLRDKYTIRIEAVARNGKEIYFKKKHFSLQTPQLIIQGPKTVNVNETFIMNIEIKNPLKQKLTGCYIAFEGIRMKRKVVRIPDITASSVGKATLSLRSSNEYKETLVIKFLASDLLRMQSAFEFTVSGNHLLQLADTGSRIPRKHRQHLTKGQREIMSMINGRKM